MQNLSAAKELLKKIGITQEQFFEAIQSFEGASGRLEKIGGSDSVTVYKDFAHAPSKVKATVKAVKDFYPDRELVACLELHTYSSLSKNYLPLYSDSMKGAQKAVVYFNPEKIKAKKLEPLSEQDIKKAFGSSNVVVTDDPQKLLQFLSEQSWKNKNLLLMSSGNFGGINLSQLVKNLGLA
jgi:UDP-N-acetylmuramate: L-alanyl-gamma-D-glutamyl-meso-diaminopimelate ligase